MKNILLINEGGLGNLGDEAIRRIMERILQDAGCSVDWVGFSGQRKSRPIATIRPEQVSEGLGRRIVKKVLPVELRWLLRNWVRFLRYFRKNKYDLILIGGGQLVQSNGLFGLAMFMWVYLFKKLHKKKVILVAVGARKSYTAFDTCLYRKSLRAVDSIYVRDRDSASVLKDIFGVSAKLIPDVAFYIDKIYEYQTRKEKRVLFCPLTYEFYRRRNPDTALDKYEYLQYWQNKVLEYLKDNYQVKLFYTSKHTEMSIVGELKQGLYDEHGIDIEVLDINTLEVLTREIAKTEVVVSGRMHALIIGYVYGCKLIPYVVSEKIKTFEEEYINSDRRLEEIQERITNTIKEIICS